MTAFRDGVARLADEAEQEIAALYARFERGQIDRDKFVALAAALIAKARMQGVGFADLALTAEIIRAFRNVESPLGLTPPDSDAERLQASVLTVLTADVVFEGDELRRSQRDRLARLARDSSAEAAVWAMAKAALERGLKGGWVRMTDADPCKLCSGWADGVVRPWSVPMNRHTGCCCVPRPVLGGSS